MTEIYVKAPCDFVSANKRYHHMAKANLTKQWRIHAPKIYDNMLKLKQPPRVLDIPLGGLTLAVK